ncbi:MAG: hypothetical protein WC582_03760 [Patescibacteria group bacterium]
MKKFFVFALVVLLFGVIIISSAVSAETRWKEGPYREVKIEKEENWKSGVLQEYPLGSSSFYLSSDIPEYPGSKFYVPLDISPETKIFIDSRKANMEDLKNTVGKDVMCYIRYEKYITTEGFLSMSVFDDDHWEGHSVWEKTSEIRYAVDVYIYVEGGGVFFLPLGS